MRTAAALLLLSFLLVTVSVDRAVAYEVWCADDPVVSIGGHLVDIQVQVPVASVAAMRSTKLTIIIPQNVTGLVVVDDVSAFPMQTTIVARGPKWDGTGSFPVLIVVEVTATTNHAVRVVATPQPGATTGSYAPVSTTGTANRRVELPLTLGP